jgi:hypothetical protein
MGRRRLIAALILIPPLAACGASHVAREALEAQGLTVRSLTPGAVDGTFTFVAVRGDEDCSGAVEVRSGDDATTAPVTMDCLPPPGAAALALPPGTGAAVVGRARHCDGGEGDACAEVGQAWARGEGLPKDAARAQLLYAQACAAQSGLGCYDLALATGGEREPPPAAAVDLMVQACDLGHTHACGEAARHLYNLDQPSARLVRMARVGCEGDDPHACMVLGVLFANGIQVPLDMEEARRKLLHACSAGLEPACGLLEAL